jgi:WD40 repeat protein
MKLFISYARLNRDPVEQLQDVLRRAGHDAWFDEEITAGDDWWQMILTSIESCDIFVFALTPESTNSDACRAEFQYAVTLNKPVLPIMLKEAELPIGRLAETHYIKAKDLRSADTVLEISRALFRLQERISAGEFAVPDPTPERPPFPFPPDPLTEVREQMAHLRSLSEEDLLQMVYRIKQVSHSSEKTSQESRKLLEKIVSNPSLPYGIVQEARIALNELPKPQSPNRWRYALGAGVVIVIMVILGLQLASSQGQLTVTQASQTALQEIIILSWTPTFTAVDTATKAPSPTDTPAPPHEDIGATETAIAEDLANTQAAIAQSNSRVITVANANEIVQLGNPLLGHSSSILTLDFSSNGFILASGSSDFSFRIWDVQTQRSTYRNTTAHKKWVTNVTFSPDGTLLATADFGGFVYLWETRNWSKVADINPDELGYYDREPTVWDLAFSPEGESIAIAFNTGTIEIWDLALEERLLTIEENARSIAFSPDARLLVSGREDGVVRIWDVSTGEMIQEFSDHVNQVNDIAFSHDGTIMVSGSMDSTILGYDVVANEQIFKFRTSGIWGIVFSLDDTLIISASTDSTVRLWDIPNEEDIKVLQGHSTQVYSLAISPDGTLIASGGRNPDNTIRLWGLPQD